MVYDDGETQMMFDGCQFVCDHGWVSSLGIVLGDSWVLKLRKTVWNDWRTGWQRELCRLKLFSAVSVLRASCLILFILLCGSIAFYSHGLRASVIFKHWSLPLGSPETVNKFPRRLPVSVCDIRKSQNHACSTRDCEDHWDDTQLAWLLCMWLCTNVSLEDHYCVVTETGGHAELDLACMDCARMWILTSQSPWSLHRSVLSVGGCEGDASFLFFCSLRTC